ncbi:uncharacterized protein [Zea mays]|uniref:Uncharacterized protein n=1 Tax=Zea mays TaxID=4577 RepID=C4IYT8_MAIZE|nr:uncharacterized protein LOC111589758 [Zea mays]ACR34088.1 unknown [Zea mays]ACR35874.1 unknown [Zea mays]ACR35978.1 unknown [Zea mays]|eukprot:XP_023156418.1 uncharacterized protein LOC111589758 [Zea mays]
MTSELASGCGPLSRTEYACLLDGRPHGVGRVALGLVASLLAGPFRLLCTGCYVKRLPFALLFTRKRGALRGALPWETQACQTNLTQQSTSQFAAM